MQIVSPASPRAAPYLARRGLQRYPTNCRGHAFAPTQPDDAAFLSKAARFNFERTGKIVGNRAEFALRAPTNAIAEVLQILRRAGTRPQRRHRPWKTPRTRSPVAAKILSPALAAAATGSVRWSFSLAMTSLLKPPAPHERGSPARSCAARSRSRRARRGPDAGAWQSSETPRLSLALAGRQVLHHLYDSAAHRRIPDLREGANELPAFLGTRQISRPGRILEAGDHRSVHDVGCGKFFRFHSIPPE